MTGIMHFIYLNETIAMSNPSTIFKCNDGVIAAMSYNCV